MLVVPVQDPDSQTPLQELPAVEDVRMRRPEMMDGAPAQSAGRLGASEHSEMDPTDGSVVHLVLACTPCRWDRGCVWRLCI